MIQSARILPLNDRPEQPGNCVLYWMQQSQRVPDNHALEYAADRANRLNLPLLVYFFLIPDFPEAAMRHYVFMLQGLEETRRALAKRGIPLILRAERPAEGLVRAARQAALAVTDRSYLRVPIRWRQEAAEKLSCPLIQVESDAVVPVDTAYPKEAYSAAVLRRRIGSLLFSYLVPLEPVRLKHPAPPALLAEHPGLPPADPETAAAALGADPSVPPVREIAGGTSRALENLERFLAEDLDRFDQDRNNPGKLCASGLSPYLHFGQISPLTVALAAGASGSPGREKFLEELIVRRELALNFTRYNENYDSPDCLPDWCRKTLAVHARDRRNPLYTPEQMEKGQTHDPYWNAAQRELTVSGRMHGYMRMYWGKKILEWSARPDEAFRTALSLNNRYALDGRDPASFAGVAWCFGKHDRPWTERPVFGTVRYMNDRGLERKFLMKEYLERISGIS